MFFLLEYQAVRKFEFAHDKDLKWLSIPVRTNIIHLSVGKF